MARGDLYQKVENYSKLGSLDKWMGQIPDTTPLSRLSIILRIASPLKDKDASKRKKLVSVLEGALKNARWRFSVLP
jgi:hypothetical protein